MRMKVDLIAAARPNFMKVAPLYHALHTRSWCDLRLVHTGQHYDPNMSETFFGDLRLPRPHIHLGVGSGSHSEQTANVMVAYEDACNAERPDLIVVVGDVNSTVACALVAAKEHIRIAHLEAGLRSADRAMPEEINRIVTDAIADILWTPSPDADENLLREGVAPSRVTRVGNIMIDSFELMRERILASSVRKRMGLSEKSYGVVTLHRPVNVDDKEELGRILAALRTVNARIPLVFPMHPRTRKNIEKFGMRRDWERSGLQIIDPLGYVDFMNLVVESRLVITDSGGIQEETTYLGIPCLTLRETTERPITISQGTNRLVRAGDLESAVERIMTGRLEKRGAPHLWDGKTALRVVADIERRMLVHGGGRSPRDEEPSKCSEGSLLAE